jgi:hypothetical protein
MFQLDKSRCIILSIVHLPRFPDEDFAMPSCVEDLQMLRLIKAFQKLTDQDARRTVVLYVEEQLEKQQARAKQTPPWTTH